MTPPPSLPAFLAEWYPHVDPAELDDINPEALERLITGYAMMAGYITNHEMEVAQ
jgi:hypothetical protein